VPAWHRCQPVGWEGERRPPIPQRIVGVPDSAHPSEGEPRTVPQNPDSFSKNRTTFSPTCPQFSRKESRFEKIGLVFSRLALKSPRNDVRFEKIGLVFSRLALKSSRKESRFEKIGLVFCGLALKSPRKESKSDKNKRLFQGLLLLHSVPEGNIAKKKSEGRKPSLSPADWLRLTGGSGRPADEDKSEICRPP